MSDAVVRLTGVSRTFGHGPAAVDAVRDATCALHAGERVALVGRSGSGKSSLLHLLAGLDRPTSGDVEWPALGGQPAGLRPGTVAVVFQGPSLLPALDATENVALPLLLAGEADDAAARAALGALERLGLLPLARLLPEELSAGQAQRVGIARALVGGPRLLLADEPTGQLDRATAATVVDALLAAAADTDAALLVTTHDRRVADLLDVRWAMHDGRLTLPEAAWSP